MAGWLNKSKEIYCLAWSGAWLTRDEILQLLEQNKELQKLTVAIVRPCKNLKGILYKRLINKVEIRKIRANDKTLSSNDDQPYAKSGRFFTLIKDSADKEGILSTLRYGTNACMVWTEHEKDIAECKELIKSLKTVTL